MEMDKYIIHEGEVWESYDDGLFIGYVQSRATFPKKRAWLSYLGPKIELRAWREIVGFLQWVYDDSKSEAQVRLYFNNNEKRWRAWAFPQEEGSGLSTKEIPEREGDERPKAGLCKGWIEAGSVHGHCGISAGQSTTDADNERNKNGLHVTVGDMNKSEYSIHARLSFKGTFYDINFEDWFESPPGLDALEWLTWRQRTDLFKGYLCRAVDSKTELFPLEWKENVIKKVHTPPTNPYTGGPTHPYQGPKGETTKKITIVGKDGQQLKLKDGQQSKLSKRERRRLRKEDKSRKESLEYLAKAIGPEKIGKLARCAAEVVKLCGARDISMLGLFTMADIPDNSHVTKEWREAVEDLERIALKEDVSLDDIEEYLALTQLIGEPEAAEKEDPEQDTSWEAMMRMYQ